MLVFLMSLTLWWALRSMRNGHFSIGLYLLLGASTLVRPDMVVPFATIMLSLWSSTGATAAGIFSGVLLSCYSSGPPRRCSGSGILATRSPIPTISSWRAIRYCRGSPGGSMSWANSSGIRTSRCSRCPSCWALVETVVCCCYSGSCSCKWHTASMSVVTPGILGWKQQVHRDRNAGIFRPPGLRAAPRQPVHWSCSAAAPGFGGIATRRWRGAIFPVLIAVSLLSINAIYGFNALLEAFLLKAPLQSGPGGENELDVREALDVRRITTPDATMAVTRAGTIPYFADRVGIDLLGKNDAHIAHEPMRRSSSGLRALVEFKPGHMKFDYAYSIEMQAPDSIMNLWQHPERGDALHPRALRRRSAWPLVHLCPVGFPPNTLEQLCNRELSRTADFDSCFMELPSILVVWATLARFFEFCWASL